MNTDIKLRLKQNLRIPTVIDKTAERSIYYGKRTFNTDFSFTCWMIARILSNNIALRSNDNLKNSFTRDKIKLTELIYQGLMDNMEVVE